MSLCKSVFGVAIETHVLSQDDYYYKPKYPTDGQEELFNNALFRDEYKDRSKGKGKDKSLDGQYYFMNDILGDIVWCLTAKELKQLIDRWLDMEQDTVCEGTDYTENLQQLEEGLFYVLICADNTPADYAKQWERVTQLLTMTPLERAGKYTAEYTEWKKKWPEVYK